jgi:hypothetical protein
MSDHRWQGYSHHELFDQIHQGPGADGSSHSVRRWTELTRALGEIDTGLAAALAGAMADWQGEAAENARGGLRPLGDWAMQAQQAAEDMRQRAEQQAEFVSKARTDMPPPVTVAAEDPGTAVSVLTHLFGGQTDYEVQEARQDAAEQRAFEVMRTYEASTTANTTSLASFAAPPQVVVDSPPVAPGSGGTVAKSPITISWAPPPPAYGPGPDAARDAGRRDGRASARGERPMRSGSSHPPASSSTPKSARRGSDDPVDRKVTEEVGRPGGFFDEHQTLSRPVIGGEPN